MVKKSIVQFISQQNPESMESFYCWVLETSDQKRRFNGARRVGEVECRWVAGRVWQEMFEKRLELYYWYHMQGHHDVSRETTRDGLSLDMS